MPALLFFDTSFFFLGTALLFFDAPFFVMPALLFFDTSFFLGRGGGAA
jgi:hypothetical protein